MRRWGWLLIGLVLVGCGGALPVATPAVQASPTVNAAATSTRGAEVAQIATLTAPTAAPSLLAAVPPTPAALISTALVPTNAPATPTPVANAGGPILTVVTVQGGDPVNVRTAPDAASPVVALVGAGSDVIVMSGSDVRDAIGQLWVPVSVAQRGGYIRSDLVGPRHVSSMPYPSAFPTPIFLATRASASSTAGPSAVVARVPPTATDAVIASKAPLREPIPGKQSKDYVGNDWLMLSPSDKNVLVLLYTVKVPYCFASPSDTIAIVNLYLAGHPEGRSTAADLLVYAALQSQGCVVPLALIAGQ